MQKEYWPVVRTLKHRARQYSLAKPWWATSLERHLSRSQPRHIYVNFLCDLYGKLISDKQHAMHVLLVLEMLNNKIKRLKTQKYDKKPALGHLSTNHPLSNR